MCQLKREVQFQTADDTAISTSHLNRQELLSTRRPIKLKNTLKLRSSTCKNRQLETQEMINNNRFEITYPRKTMLLVLRSGIKSLAQQRSTCLSGQTWK